MTPDTKIEEISRLNNLQKQALDKLEIKTVKDLLFYLPSRYSQPGEIKLISELTENQNATIYGKIVSLKMKKGFRSSGKKLTV